MDHETGMSADKRLEQVESQIHGLMGHVKALEYGLRLLIAPIHHLTSSFRHWTASPTKRSPPPRLRGTCQSRCIKRPSIRA
jgi:hypothetical protein